MKNLPVSASYELTDEANCLTLVKLLRAAQAYYYTYPNT